MLLIKTKIGKSRIHGIGLFANEFIAAETVVWKFSDLIDLCFDEKQIAGLSENVREQISRYCYRDKRSGMFVLCGDDARFFNHSNAPNCLDFYDYKDLGNVTIAARDINAGEELTCNYAAFDQDFVETEYAAPVSNLNIAAIKSRFRRRKIFTGHKKFGGIL